MPFKSQQLINTIKSSSNVLIVSHENPDGDTLGSGLALSHFLDNENIKHQYYCHNKPAPYFEFMPKIENIIDNYDDINIDDHDLIIAIDCGDIKRTKIIDDLIRVKEKITIINFDHHHNNDNFGHFNIVLPEASSTSEIIYKFFKVHNISINKYMATNLLTGIITDTSNFTNAATTQDSLTIASELINLGGRAKQIINAVTQNKNLNDLKLWGKLLSRLQINPKYNCAYTVITQKDLQTDEIEPESIDGLSNFLSNMNGVDFILVLMETDDNKIKGSLRTTKNNVDVSKFAAKFGGGGHKKAAGFKIDGSLLKTATGWQIKA